MTAAFARMAGRPHRAAGLLRPAKTRAEVERARAMMQRIGDLSDNIVGVGPFGIGLDGVLAWVPFVGTAYSVGAGGLLLYEGWRAKVGPARMGAAAALMLSRTMVGVVPLFGDILVDLVRGHRISAKLLQRGVDRTLYVEGSRALAEADPVRREQIAAARRVVFLEG